MTENRFTQGAQVALMQAFNGAKRMSHNFIGSEHILMGIFQETTSRACAVLTEAGITAEGLAYQMSHRMGCGQTPSKNPVSLSDEATAIIEGAAAQAALMKTREVSPEHLLMAIAARPECGAMIMLKSFGITPEALRRGLSQPRAAMQQPQQPYGLQQQARQPQGFGKRELKLTLQFGVDMTQRAALGAYDPVVGRENETDRLVQVLSRRQKSNPVLLGDAGVGKTAIVENLATLISTGGVPLPLVGKRLVSLDLAGMISGTKYRGEFEERTRQVIDEVRLAGNVILFIDEMHMIAGAGAAEGAIDAANIMKPALSRGHIQVIGATTPAEYKKYIRRDSALARRFQPIDIGEPAPEQAKVILRALRPRYERHHSIKIDDTAIEAAVELSGRYIQGRYLPDKAIDLLDEASAYAVLSRRPVVGDAEIKQVLAQVTGVEAGDVDETERRRLLGLPRQLRESLVGQEQAVDAVARAVRRARAFGGRGRPGSFLFCGPSGVGKTQLARGLAKALFGSEEQMLRLDMSEFMERHSVSRLIGSPPGYVGFGEGGQLTEGIRRRPYSVVLFDEVEKAHPDVLNVLLQVLEDGALTDGEGERVSFQSAIIIMTSNIGLERLAGARRTGFTAGRAEDLSADVLQAVKKAFRPELLNRIDQIAVFRPLSPPQLRQIAQRELGLLQGRVAQAGIGLQWDEPALDALAKTASDPAMGARPLKRAITEKIEDRVAELWLLGSITSAARVTAQDGEIVVN